MTDNTMTVAYAGLPIKYDKPVYPHGALPVLTDMDVPSTILMQTLYRALRSRRAGDSMSEAKFVAWLVNRLPVTMIDAAGNIHVDLCTQPTHRTMFTSHTDTVHHVGGANQIRLDTSNPRSVKWRAGEGACLGADDGAGIALMVHMIDAGVPGYYVFFRGEERGGVGSSWLADNMPLAIKDLDRCVSFDRADYADVITHQGMGRCCSDEFAMALAAALTTDDMTLCYLPDDTGVFTDSANLTDLIPECTNLSVGYKHQHGDGEWQDITFLQLLAAQVVLVQWDALPVGRDPTVKENIFGKWSIKGTSVPVGRFRLNDEELYLVDALFDASFGHTRSLRGIVAEWMLPEEPHTAEPHINCGRLDSEEYARLANGLEMGEHEYDSVLGDLVDRLYKE